MKKEEDVEFLGGFDIKDLNFRDILIKEVIQELEDAAYDFGRAGMVMESLAKIKAKLPAGVRNRAKIEYDRKAQNFNVADVKLRNIIKMLLGK